MSYRGHCLVFFSVVWAFANAQPGSAAESIPAFPGAQGGGAASRGGRGGRIIEVVNLNDRGVGSFRAACEASGPRIVVFRVAGTIELGRSISIESPYITVAGQTGPGGGVLLKGNELGIATHDVVVRFLRVRTGRNDAFAHQQGDCIALRSGCDRVVIDHCSVSWSNDENIQIWSGNRPSHHVTFSWNLIGEGLTYDHASCGLIVGSDVDSVGIYRQGAGRIPEDENAVGGYPAIEAGAPYADDDHDGMSDAWELGHGLDPQDASDGPKDADMDGYSNVEEFLNGTDPRGS